jgi:5'-3' exonuclease
MATKIYSRRWPGLRDPPEGVRPSYFPRVRVHLIDGTYELYRHYYGMPGATDRDGHEVGAVIGVLGSMLSMIHDGVTHLGVATDHVIESFRNELWPGYKTGEGIEPALWSQFHRLEDALRAMGVVVWPMVEFEADDALASAARIAAADERVERVFICTPDKDLSQCVVGERVIQFDRRQRELRDEAGVIAKFGVRPAAIPDYLALVGDSADGFPGVPGWGAKSAAAVLAKYHRLEAIPADARDWEVAVRGAARLAGSLQANRDLSLLFRRLATLRVDAPLFQSVDELRWAGPRPEFEAVAARLAAPQLWTRATR